MLQRPLRLGTRRSLLARAQSSAVARRLEQVHHGLKVELVGIDTRGDRITSTPLSQVDGKEFFTAEIDAALRAGDVDLTVHSYKDLSLERPADLHLGAVPARENPRDIVYFAADVPQRLATPPGLRAFVPGACAAAGATRRTVRTARQRRYSPAAAARAAWQRAPARRRDSRLCGALAAVAGPGRRRGRAAA